MIVYAVLVPCEPSFVKNLAHIKNDPLFYSYVKFEDKPVVVSFKFGSALLPMKLVELNAGSFGEGAFIVRIECSDWPDNAEVVKLGKRTGDES